MILLLLNRRFEFKTLNGRQFGFTDENTVLRAKITVKCSPIVKIQSSNSEAGVRSENQFVVYIKHSELQYFHLTLRNFRR